MIFAAKLKNMVVAGLIGAGVLLGASQQAGAVTFPFENIPGAGVAGDAYAGNFSLDVTDLGSGNALFQIVSAAAPALNYFIRTIFVHDSSPSLFTALPNRNDQSHSVGTVNMRRYFRGNLPQGNNVGFSTDFIFNRVPGAANANAIQQGETGGFILGVSGSFASIISALTSGELRFGIHLQRLPGGASDSFVNSVTPVPLTAAGILLIGALGGLGFAARRKKRMAA